MNLKPCPFCNSKAVYMEYYDGDCESFLNYRVECSNRECCTEWEDFHAGREHKPEYKERVIRKWNTRPMLDKVKEWLLAVCDEKTVEACRTGGDSHYEYCADGDELRALAAILADEGRGDG
jgi:hypothetical protein